jgi:oxygen-independent coproporphyrinogen-3 oxidase
MNKDNIKVLLAKYDYPVPRYTSFPTAVQFKPLQDPRTYFDCLNKLTPSEPVSLYVHIPFCHSLCHYCGCHTKIVHSYSPIASYIDTLIKEIELVGRNFKAAQSVSRIHFGGGSPNYAKTEDIKRILDTLGRYVDLSSAQIDMECDPRLLNEEKISDYAVLGLTRISLGIQDFDAGVQKAINRIQPFDMVKKQIEALHRNGIHNINFDLIIGLPEQTLVTVNETLDKVLELQPARVAVFPYAHVPWMKKHQKLLEKYEMPETFLRYEMAKLTETRLKEEGYEAVGIDHFARPDDPLADALKNRKMRRNFQGYTDDPARTILGFGLSSISQFEEAYTQNTTDAPLYRKTVDNGEVPLARVLTLTRDDQDRRKLIEELMCNFTINFADYKSIPVPRSALVLLEQDGLIEIAGSHLRVTEIGRTFVRIIASHFDPYFKKESNRHAKAV